LSIKLETVQTGKNSLPTFHQGNLLRKYLILFASQDIDIEIIVVKP